MKVIIAGPRDLNVSVNTVYEAVLASKFHVTLVVSGGASGVDEAGIKFAKWGFIPYLVVPADWRSYRRRAGPIRNARMADIADVLLVIKVKGVDTKGTSNMIEQVERRNMPIYVHEVGA